jgi:hypothetical protein
VCFPLPTAALLLILGSFEAIIVVWWTCGGRRLAQMLWRKSHAMSGARLLRCWRNCDGFWSSVSLSEELSHTLFMWGRRPVHQLCFQPIIGLVLWWWSYVFYLGCVLLFELWHHVVELGLLEHDGFNLNWAFAYVNQTAGRSGQKGGRCTATLYTAALSSCRKVKAVMCHFSWGRVTHRDLQYMCGILQGCCNNYSTNV